MSQLSKTSFGNLYGTSGSTFPDNTTGDISEGDMRTFGKDILDSALFITDNFVDEDDMASDSATKVPSQQSVKAYAEAHGASTMLYTTVSISSSEILNLHSVRKVLIAAPGANKAIRIRDGAVIYTFGTTQYTTGGSGNLVANFYGSGTHLAASIPTGFMTLTSSQLAPVGKTTTVLPFTQCANASVELLAASQLSAGDGTVKVKLWYEVIDLV